MATSFSQYRGSGQNDDFSGAMEAMAGSRRFQPPDPAAGMAKWQDAVGKANAWADRGVAAFGGMSDQMTAMAGDTANAGMQMVASKRMHQSEMDAARAAQAAQKKSGIFGTIAQGLGIGLSLLCERRLKTNINTLDSDRAWQVVRSLPLYSFNYKAAPGPTVYGPMIDEVETLDPSLVRPSLLPDDEDGPVRGFDVMRHQAYESLALQQALHRIEGLEANLAKLQDATARLLLERMPALAEAA